MYVAQTFHCSSQECSLVLIVEHDERWKRTPACPRCGRKMRWGDGRDDDGEAERESA